MISGAEAYENDGQQLLKPFLKLREQLKEYEEYDYEEGHYDDEDYEDLYDYNYGTHSKILPASDHDSTSTDDIHSDTSLSSLPPTSLLPNGSPKGIHTTNIFGKGYLQFQFPRFKRKSYSS